MGIMPETVEGLSLVLVVSALLAHACTAMIRALLKYKGWHAHRLVPTWLRFGSMLIGGAAGVAASSAWIPGGKPLGGLLLGFVAGAFCTVIVWAGKAVLRRRFGADGFDVGGSGGPGGSGRDMDGVGGPET